MKLTKFSMLTAGMALAVAAAFGACGGDDDGDDDASTPTRGNTPAATRTAATGADDETPEAEPTDDEPSGDEGDVAAIKALARKFVEAKFRADYTVTGAPGEPLSEGTVKLIKDGADKFRFDLTSPEGQITFIQTPDIAASCLSDADALGADLGLEAGEGVCFSQDEFGTGGIGNLAEDLEDFVAGNVLVLETSERIIVGETVKCYLTQEENQEITNVCINGDGVLLAVESPDGSKLEATGYSDDVSDSDFELPYELRDLPAVE